MSDWVVVKFGGTSVSTVERWKTIEAVARRCVERGERPFLVCSALSGVSDLLEKLADLAVENRYKKTVATLRQRHQELAQALGVDFGVIEEKLDWLERLATGLSLTQEATPRLRAQIMATGELLSTRLGAAALEAWGLPVRWLDAREMLKAEEQPGATLQQSYLSATCSSAADPALQKRLASETACITQGFIASNSRGQTVLLGRGGSDTSAAYFAARLGAQRLEIWTDVAGMYTADPRRVPTARLLRRLDYTEAQELATVGAKVLHPRCLGPVQEHGIPLHIKCTQSPELVGTVIAPRVERGGRVKAVSSKNGVTLISMETLGMWHQVGFLASVFDCFRRYGISVDLVATSETNVTVTLDVAANVLEGEVLELLMGELALLCKPRLVRPCATVSLVGTRIRSIMHRLAPVLELFEDERIHMVSQAASDLNLTFVVNQDQAERLVGKLHALLFSGLEEDQIFGPTWQDQFETPARRGRRPRLWWEVKREALLEMAAGNTPLYVYDRETLEDRARRLLELSSVDRVLYAIKANSNPDVLRVLRGLGVGFECVSPGELRHLRELFPDLSGSELLYTPNFASRQDYAAGFEAGARVTLDNLQPLQSWPDVFGGQELFVRLDPGKGSGHHRHVRTAGPGSKFGVSREQLPRLKELTRELGIRVVGLHAHSGSGIKTIETWAQVASYLASAAEEFPEVEVLDLGGGLWVPEKPADRPMDLARFDQELATARKAFPRFSLWLEPGRYLVAEAGVLLVGVNQTKRKGNRGYVGVDTGMNSLIRPALYGAYHPIVNLTRLGEKSAMVVDVVGPICETGDVLGHDRRLPETAVGDILLVATTGAYGRAMSSGYNLREPAAERLLEAARR